MVVVGDVAVDVLVRPSAALVPGADVPAAIRTLPGGAGANTAAWLAHLGASVTLVGRVGDDPAGRAAAAELVARGIEPVLAVDPDHPTCTVVALLGDDDRTMLSDRGAAARLSPADLPALDGADHLHLSGYVLLDDSSRPAGLAALATAAAAGLSTSVDPQAAPALTAEFLRWIRGTDLLLPNAAELAALTSAIPDSAAPGRGDPGSATPDSATPDSAAPDSADSGSADSGSADSGGAARGSGTRLLDVVGAVAATSGPGPVTWTDRSGRWAVPAPAVRVVDPTGAGDAFDAGLLVARLAGAGPEAALRSGCAAAAAAVSRLGARPS